MTESNQTRTSPATKALAVVQASIKNPVRLAIEATIRTAKHAEECHSFDKRGRVFRERMLRWAAIATLCALAMPAASAQSPRANSPTPATDHARKSAMIDAGQIVFNQRCEICHYVDSRAQKIGPGLAGLFARAKFASGAKVSEASVAGLIADGGKDMPAYRTLLKPGQLQALLAYLKSH